MSYDYTNGDGLDALDATKPDGATEPVSNLDDAVKQIKAFLKDTTAGYAKLAADVVALGGQVGGLNNRAAFVVYLSSAINATQASGTVLVEFDQESFDPDGVFDVATHQFTAPAAGLYLFLLSYRLDTTASSSPVTITHRLKLYKNGAPASEAEFDRGTQTNGITHTMPRLLSLAAGDDVDARFEITTVSGTIACDVTADALKTVFQGFKVA